MQEIFLEDDFAIGEGFTCHDRSGLDVASSSNACLGLSPVPPTSLLDVANPSSACMSNLPKACPKKGKDF